jgi:PTS system, mannose/fructose/sorbose family, IIA component
MVALIIATHGEFSREIVRSAEMIFGKQDDVEIVTFAPGEGPDDLKKKYQAAYGRLNQEDGVLFLVDLFGGSPFNAASNFAAEKENTDVITGLNLPMLIECFSKRQSLGLRDLVEDIEKTAVEGVRSLRKTLEAADDSEEDF